MKALQLVSSVLSLSLLSTVTGQAGDEILSGSKDIAKSVIYESEKLDVSFVIPGWLAGVEGDIGFRPDVTTGVNATIGDILPTVDMIAAGTLEFRKGKLGFTLDGLYMDLSINGETPGPLLNDITVGMKYALVDGLVTYRVLETETAWVEILLGGRYTYLQNDVSFTRILRGPQTLTATNSWVDPFVGIQGQYQFADQWYAKARADYGGFGVSSDSTYNLFGAIGFQIRERSSIELGYRYLYTDYTNGGFEYDMATKGAFVGLRFNF